MSDIRCVPRSVVLKSDMDWTKPDLEFDSCSEAISFLWNLIGRSRTWVSVRSSFYYACNMNKSLFGYVIVRDPNYVLSYE